MVRVGLIGCTSSKLETPCRAVDMFSASVYFNLRLEYCKKNNIDKIFILSSKYGLLELDDVIEPYDCYLKTMSKEYRSEWDEKVLNQLKSKTDIINDEFVLLAGVPYVENLCKHLKHTYNPVEGLGIGRQLKYFKEHSKEDAVISDDKFTNDEKLEKKTEIVENRKYAEFSRLLDALDEMDYDIEKMNPFYIFLTGRAKLSHWRII